MLHHSGNPLGKLKEKNIEHRRIISKIYAVNIEMLKIVGRLIKHVFVSNAKSLNKTN